MICALVGQEDGFGGSRCQLFVPERISFRFFVKLAGSLSYAALLRRLRNVAPNQKQASVYLPRNFMPLPEWGPFVSFIQGSFSIPHGLPQSRPIFRILKIALSDHMRDSMDYGLDHS